ncbi:4-hydroxythreonine-4-phosphate dehydrogenase PdxA [Trichloromonas acetexigens]|uniref:4-hydroxythreonine-4-phosphate dehydrogenase n=1 Tax=Trichloromonas acetexigens TaxID=38815 RepID=A0A550JFK4_9BACT|nr:4-hydroxythreonine-4-phosphate dehydrogenase PdxA [Desulfuromonas acetexigens]TRO81978.1 4-hydroxythreonine-4-phosphate dehydrogenase PdxA [Desulfuromonas acetexigens]
MQRPLVITQGDPTGIGPEIIVKALLEGAFDALSRPLWVAGDPAVLRRAATVFGVPCEVVPVGERLRLVFAGRALDVVPLSELAADKLIYGRSDIPCGRAMLRYIEWACDACLSGEVAAMVTAPISKAAIHAAGCDFPGHTELLAERCGVGKVVMMLAGERLKVCLVTTHLALAEVPRVLSEGEILETIRITDAAFRRFFGRQEPRIAVLALNPHAGEQRLFGDEEPRLIAPAIARAQAEGIAASGPHSADTLFHFAVRGGYDAVVCMYHDQGLIPLKLLHFDDGVNVTLGLPIVRTSVDHGTAYDLAGTGKASAESLVAAVKMAEQMAAHL